MNINEYFKNIQERVESDYVIANAARAKGLDPETKVEIPIALSLAEKSVGLISSMYPQLMADGKIVHRILELEKQYSSLDPAVALTIAEEIAKEKFCKFESHLQAIEAGARVAIAYLTLGVVSSPIEGFVNIHLQKTKNGEDYFAPFYAGPIRSAGGTEAAFSLVIVDYLRETFGYARYDPTEEEVKRGVHESYLYHERITNLQYLPTEQEIDFLMRNLPVQVSGDPSEKKEVFNYKDLPRIGTNFIRSGFCLTLNEGMAQKAPKIWKRVEKLREKGFKLTDWDWLGEFVKFQTHIKEGKKKEGGGGAVYIRDLVAGRPVFGHPSCSGAFRLRYGRARNTGYSALAVHPATMWITGGFIASGTQLKIEKPTKGCATASCTTIDGPIVKMKNGSVKRIYDPEEAKRIYPDVEEIVYFGDLLIPYGDFANRNHVLDKPGYVEQYWLEHLLKAGGNSELNIPFDEALELSRKYKIPLHPSYIYYWREISIEEFEGLIDWIGHGEIRGEILVLPYSHVSKERFRVGKRALELIGCDHEVVTEDVVLNKKDSAALMFNIGIGGWLKLEQGKLGEEMEAVALKIKGLKVEGVKVLDVIKGLSELEIKDKSGTFIGSRMGRPEKAKLRKLTGSPHVLFPVGEEGGRLRSFQAAMDNGRVTSHFPNFFCENCDRETVYGTCEVCGNSCKKKELCPVCGKRVEGKCEEHGRGVNYKEMKIEVRDYFDVAKKLAGVRTDEIPIVKGIRGTSSNDHSCENLAKGLLRAKYNLHVNKDGTIRYDISEMPLTHFKPKEIGTSVAKLKELGYEKDVYGFDLENDNQVLEIFPHDVVLPACPDTLDEKADDVFLKVSKFVDDELERMYGQKKFFNANKADDLAGVLLGCMAPHNCAAVVGRLIGFSKTQGLLASPYMHAAMRRDCVYPTTKLFFYDKNGEIFYDEIGDYVERLIKEGAETKKIDGVGTLSVENKREIYALGIDPETHELKRKKIKYFVKGPETREWIKIKTATNREYVMTPTHKFMYVEEGKFKFKNAKEVKIGDKLPVLEKFNFEFDKNKLNLFRLFKDGLNDKEKKEIFVRIGGEEMELGEAYEQHSLDKLEKMACEMRWKFSKHVFNSDFELTKEFMRVLGYYASEGYSRKNKSVSQVSFRICDNETQKGLIEDIKKVFGFNPNLGEDNSKITICSKLVYYLFKCIGAGQGAYSKRVPSFIFGLRKELVKEYLSAYFDGDGSVIKGKNIVFYSVSRTLLDDVGLLLAKFECLGRYLRTEERLPGKKVLDRYRELGKEPKKHILNHLVLGVYDSFKIGKEIGCRCIEKKNKLDNLKQYDKRYVKYNGMQVPLVAQSDYVEDFVKQIEIVKDSKNSYCVEIDWKEKEDRNVLWGEQIINTRCDGDEAAVMLLMDMLINFSRHFLPAHRGGTQDAPLVLNARMKAGEVDDMIFDVDVSQKMPLELYEAAELGKSPYEVKMEQVKKRLGGDREFKDLWFMYDTEDINLGPVCSSYKSLPSMGDKVAAQMVLCKKIRAVDTSDVARLIIERHFIRDTRGNLRKFSMQGFRCVGCNEKYRRPPLVGKCEKCGGRIIFTISEGSIMKYMQPALDLARDFKVSPYLLESLELTEMYIQSIFGKEKEIQENISKWF